MGCKTPFFPSPVQTGIPRELAESLTRATQPGLVSPAVSDSRSYPTVPSGEPFIRVRGSSAHMDANLSSRSVSMVMRSPCAGDALAPPLWKIPNKALSPTQGVCCN
jgi:hypothetical protein